VSAWKDEVAKTTIVRQKQPQSGNCKPGKAEPATGKASRGTHSTDNLIIAPSWGKRLEILHVLCRRIRASIQGVLALLDAGR